MFEGQNMDSEEIEIRESLLDQLKRNIGIIEGGYFPKTSKSLYKLHNWLLIISAGTLLALVNGIDKFIIPGSKITPYKFLFLLSLCFIGLSMLLAGLAQYLLLSRQITIENYLV